MLNDFPTTINKLAAIARRHYGMAYPSDEHGHI